MDPVRRPENKSFPSDAVVSSSFGSVLARLINTEARVVTAAQDELSERIKKAGSDEATERKLAALIGRLRVDEVVRESFRQVVAPMKQKTISSYLRELTLETSGPTVQQGLTNANPAFLSMIIQISFLSFGHETQTLSEGITQAVEEGLEAAGSPAYHAPDYLSVIDVVFACQQQTAQFGWAYVYESIEARIREMLGRQETRQRPARSFGLSIPAAVANRSMPYPILKALLLHLGDIQTFPEHRLLQLSMDRGISSVVVWCFYILGLSVKVKFGTVEVLFGKEPANISIEQCHPSRTCATLLERTDDGEPIFTFSPSDGDPPIQGDCRLEARGFARKSLSRMGLSSEEIEFGAHWLAATCLQHFEANSGSTTMGDVGVVSAYTCIGQEIAPSVLFLFDMERFDDGVLGNLLRPGRKGGKQPLETIKWPSLAVLIYLLARIEDRESCAKAPLSFSAFHELAKTDHDLSYHGNNLHGQLPTIIESYELLARLVLGRQYSEDFVEKSFLVSACGWSLHLSIADTEDPENLGAGQLHLKVGVPTRRGIRRSKIVDGQLDVAPVFGITVSDGNPPILFWPGVWSGRCTSTFTGNQGRTAFSAVQHYTWTHSGEDTLKMWKFGFRSKLEISTKFDILASCPCTTKPSAAEDQAWMDAHLAGGQPVTDELYRSYRMSDADLLPEIIFQRARIDDPEPFYGVRPSWFFFVTNSGAARWLALDGLERLNPDSSTYMFLLRGRECCISCAVQAVPPSNYVVLL